MPETHRGDPKIVDALYEAQAPTGPTPALTRDEIAAWKHGRTCSEVFNTMKAQGLLQERTIRQVLSGYAQRHRPVRASASGPTGRGR